MTATRASTTPKPSTLLVALALLFFFSGASALIYQVLWLRMLALVFGVTVYAASTVLAGFMSGLALGSYGAGRIAARFASPLRTFGLIEIGVGLDYGSVLAAQLQDGALDPRLSRLGLGGAFVDL